jgi:sensor histidine kinase YesM
MLISKITHHLGNFSKPSIEGKNLIFVAILITLAITLKSTLTLLGFIPMDLNNTYPITMKTWLYSFGVISTYSWLILDFNLKRKSKLFPKISQVGSFSILLIGNLIIFCSTIAIQIIGEYLIESVLIANEKLYATTFGWIIIFIASLLIVEIFKLQQKSKHDDIDKEILKREKIQSELNEIKNQMNPHFLFNSLNSLYSLIRSNPEKATLFVTNLSKLYRYVLQSKEKDMVSIEEELAFLKNYTDLIHIRYREKFQIKIDMKAKDYKLYLPVLSIQLLVENAIKHNEISKEHPLKVFICIENEYLIVTHKLRPRKTLIQSTGNGIVSLSRRCQFLIGRDIEIQKKENFTVRIPIKNN